MIIINILIYAIYVVAICFNIENINIVSFAIDIYILPIFINTIFFILYNKKQTRKKYIKIISPILSTVSYIVIGLFIQENGMWQNFIYKNTYSTDELEVEIVPSLISVSQIIFVLILYFGIGYLINIIISKRGKENK